MNNGYVHLKDAEIIEDMNITIVGHVDHGKSTIIGRLLADTNSLPLGKLDQVKEQCRRNSKPFEYAFLLDALKEERSQGITIDTARCFFKTDKRRYILIDAPGHTEFLKNMVTGASRAEAALIVIDANEGIQDNSKRHGYMLSMLGIKQVVVLVNKMDLVNYDENIYDDIVDQFSKFLSKINIYPQEYIPVSGMAGDNIATFSDKMPWYKGVTLLQTLDSFSVSQLEKDKPFRMFVQGVYKFTENGDDRRIVAGTIDSGKVKVGDEIIFYPSYKKSFIKSIEAFNQEQLLDIYAGSAAGFTLEHQIYVSRGQIAALSTEKAPIVAMRAKVNLFWLGNRNLVKNRKYIFKLGTTKVRVELESVKHIINSVDLSMQSKEMVEKLDVAECIFKFDRTIAFDLISDMQNTSRFVIVDDYKICGGGIIIEGLEDDKEAIIPDRNITWNSGKLTYEDRCKKLKQKGSVVWLTGMSGAGKSTIATELEKELFKLGKFVYRIDGDNIRFGLNSNLGFSDEDRNENIRRIAEVAALFKDSGMISIVSAISPFESMREFAKTRVAKHEFIEVFVKASLETCINRDPKGLYRKALIGKIDNFTGITSKYEEPKAPDVIVDTDSLTVRESVELILKKVLELC
jgi:bifunctional enzyme CysN/CysC